MKVTVSKIICNQQVINNIFKIVIQFSDVIKAGQFFMLKTLNDEFLLPRPISVHDCNSNSVTFLYRVGGRGTQVISKLQANDEIQVFGPLGNGFDIDKIKGKIAIVGGGIGTAPLLYLTKKLNKDVDVFLGFKDVVYSVDEFSKHSNNVWITTEDGSVGQKGFVTSLIDFKKYDTVVTCGPEVMMNVVMNKCEEENIRCFVSLEKRMACGLGACLGCAIETKDGMKRVCKDGPVFEISELVR
ncbi:dihydroorotate dehydrogenase electron transfer subunit [Sedimentibacter sp. zth1]|uniref:dihydroorotate dehydrogenase electron transfer subunit n=1 Tax=Sedimentibacter sp. zth1 TaxID=2816908 RepID=UPI001A912A43|nr:dihydroorotate dehydrogenase electron transfer subunit [Sedimentibacter sp. zth1]QSX05205.1 dihydroorotate dehydrogenase electron transfer subunit [Sedimentibacter sp. zth1]